MKKKKFNWIAFIFFLALVIALFFGWVYLRNESLSIPDLGYISIGVISFLWMIFWMNTKHVSKHSLFIPFSPVFFVTLIGFVLRKFNLISGINLLNLMVFFFEGYMISFLIYSVMYNRRKV